MILNRPFDWNSRPPSPMKTTFVNCDYCEKDITKVQHNATTFVLEFKDRAGRTWTPQVKIELGDQFDVCEECIIKALVLKFANLPEHV